MTDIQDNKKTIEYFDNHAGTFANVKSPRDKILFDIIIPICKKELGNNMVAIDFGCGGGNQLLELNNLGVYAYGIEKSEALYNIAKERILNAGYEEKQIIKGGIEELDRFDSESVDVVILMGVFQYLSDDEYEKAFKIIHRILKINGHLVGTFQNAFFDLFTFNKYTLGFYKEKFFKPLGIDKLTKGEAYEDLKKLITNPEKPDYSPDVARDNIFVRITNPITIDEELKEKGFKILDKYFYEFHFLPRLIEKKYETTLMPLANEFEVKKSKEWFGYFMANAFLAHCVKI